MRTSISLTLVVLLIFCLSFTSLAWAIPIVQFNGSGEATGIINLEIDSMFVSVEFIQGISYNDLYQTTPPLFFGNNAGSFVVAQTIADALNILPQVDGIAGVGDCPTCVISVPFGVDSKRFQRSTIGLGVVTLAWQATAVAPPASRSGTSVNTVLTRFQQSSNPIPEPSTILLLGTGLIGLATLRYRRTM